MSPRKLRRRAVVERHLAGDWVLIDPAGRTVHVLNPTAWSLWELCDGRRSVQAVIAEVARRYDVHELEATEGCLDVIARLRAAALLTETDP
jgi:Coenzyme PQQ synthesis protein D (PqqD)